MMGEDRLFNKLYWERLPKEKFWTTFFTTYKNKLKMD